MANSSAAVSDGDSSIGSPQFKSEPRRTGTRFTFVRVESSGGSGAEDEVARQGIPGHLAQSLGTGVDVTDDNIASMVLHVTSCPNDIAGDES